MQTGKRPDVMSAELHRAGERWGGGWGGGGEQRRGGKGPCSESMLILLLEARPTSGSHDTASATAEQ